jgi:hypothetical protein
MIEGQWKSDGLDASGQASWLVDNEDVATGQELSVNVEGGSPMNLIFNPSTNTPLLKFCFQIYVVSIESSSTSLGVGVVRPSEFRKGYGTKGMFYNGNLTNGSAALKVSYGPRPETGDVILVEYTELDDSFKVCFHVNGKSLGVAFQVPKEIPASESFLPCFHVMGGIKVRVSTSIEMASITNTKVHHPLEDNWSLLEAFDEASQQTIWPVPVNATNARSSPLTLHMAPNNGHWFLALKVCNTLRVQRVISELEGGDNDAKKYGLSGPNGVMTTMMMPRPPLNVVEPILSNALGSQWKSFVLEGNDTLRVLSESGGNLATFQRVLTDKNAVACTSYDN